MLMRVAAVNNYIDAIEPTFEKALVRRKLELVRHDTGKPVMTVGGKK